MRPFLLVLAVLAASAYAGTRFVVTTSGTLPQKATDGVSLQGMSGCRAVVSYTDGGHISGGKIIPHYYDTGASQWVEGATANTCTLDTSTLADGGARAFQVCEWVVNAQYGRAAVVGSSLTPQAIAQLRFECWGPNVPNADGGSP